MECPSGGDDGGRWHPGSAAEREPEGVQRGHTVLAGGGDVTRDLEAAGGRGLGGEPSADLLLGLERPKITLRLVVRRPHVKIDDEAEHVVLPVAQALEQAAADRLFPAPFGRGIATCPSRIFTTIASMNTTA